MEDISIDASLKSNELLKNIDNQDLQNAEWNDLVQMGQDAGEVKTYTQWLLGKLGDAVSRKYGDLKKYANEIRQEYGTLQQYMNTYRKFIHEDVSFHPSKYFGSVPWGVLALAATKSDEPQKLIDELQRENKEVSLKVAYREIKRKESPDNLEPSRKPQVKLTWNKSTGLYTLSIKPEDYPSIDWNEVKHDLKTWLDGLI